MRIIIGLALLAAASPAIAQDDSWMLGEWTGEAVTPFDDNPRHRIRIIVGRQRSGEPTATIRYETLRCFGSWGDAADAGRSWFFREIVTEDEGGNCPDQMSVEVTRVRGGIRIYWREVGADRIMADATLTRRSR